MGSKASKPVQSATRKFPSRTPGSAVPPPPRPSARNPEHQASFTKDNAIRADGQDPDPMTNPAFSARLRQMGVATPNPTLSNSSTANPQPHPTTQSQSRSSPIPGAHYPSSSQNRTLNALEARQRLQEQARTESETPGIGREFLDIGTLKQILVLRARGTPAPDIERRLRLKSGVVGRIGPEGVVLPVTTG
ncbi:Uu.00g034370.m01.CDS01 [Anthostomella pinea]|uniref:Uu.00g034370.m01.CDS01 n=1 Tax=Anthostomella pinea TaxID=933095 RepID=A0AAI8V922_9PEZI|nr:Uu.00g034370.m01.CDS01 [Anthostomella pinea]